MPFGEVLQKEWLIRSTFIICLELIQLNIILIYNCLKKRYSSKNKEEANNEQFSGTAKV